MYSTAFRYFQNVPHWLTFNILILGSTGFSSSKDRTMSLILTMQSRQSPVPSLISLTEALALAMQGKRYLTLKSFMDGAAFSKSVVRLKVRPLSTRVPSTSVSTEPTGTPNALESQPGDLKKSTLSSQGVPGRSQDVSGIPPRLEKSPKIMFFASKLTFFSLGIWFFF